MAKTSLDQQSCRSRPRPAFSSLHVLTKSDIAFFDEVEAPERVVARSAEHMLQVELLQGRTGYLPTVILRSIIASSRDGKRSFRPRPHLPRHDTPLALCSSPKCNHGPGEFQGRLGLVCCTGWFLASRRTSLERDGRESAQEWPTPLYGYILREWTHYRNQKVYAAGVPQVYDGKHKPHEWPCHVPFFVGSM